MFKQIIVFVALVFACAMAAPAPKPSVLLTSPLAYSGYSAAYAPAAYSTYSAYPYALNSAYASPYGSPYTAPYTSLGYSSLAAYDYGHSPYAYV